MNTENWGSSDSKTSISRYIGVCYQEAALLIILLVAPLFTD
jgi:hypothetical protein